MARAKPVAAYPRKPNLPPSAAADAFVETGRAPAAEPEAPPAPPPKPPAEPPPVIAAPPPPPAEPDEAPRPRPRAPASPAAPAPVAQAIDLPTGRAVMQLKDGRRVRRTTMLLEDELARRLDVFAAGRGIDKAVVVNAALKKWLSEQGA
jgi:hypothetical protein